jgi:hypothetical protein
MTYLEQLKNLLLEDAKELQKRKDIYEANDDELKKGTAVKTEIALAAHAAIKADIDRRKVAYYELEEEIERIEGLENNK